MEERYFQSSTPQWVFFHVFGPPPLGEKVSYDFTIVSMSVGNAFSPKRLIVFFWNFSWS